MLRDQVDNALEVISKSWNECGMFALCIRVLTEQQWY